MTSFTYNNTKTPLVGLLNLLGENFSAIRLNRWVLPIGWWFLGHGKERGSYFLAGARVRFLIQRSAFVVPTFQSPDRPSLAWRLAQECLSQFRPRTRHFRQRNRAFLAGRPSIGPRALACRICGNI